jgi:hypothetical protein
MKQPSLCTAAYVSPLFVLLVTITVLMTGTSDAWGYEAYSTDKTSGYCADCHGGFRSSPYTSLAEGANWGDDLHDVHRRTMLSSDCSTCHGSSRFPVSLDSSSGGAGLAAISCVGCHGRDDDIGNDSESTGRGAGLRQAHTNAGVLDCTDCHSDADPENYTPVGEDVLPNYYANPANHPVIPTDSCNANGEEGAFAGSLLGLDNDGDTVYDTADSDCAPTGCQSDAECDDAMFCNGTETCNVGTGQCEAGPVLDVDDGVGCTEDSCDEANDVVVNTPNDGLCDNGAFCNGVETCDAIDGCQVGAPPCDPASETCNEVGDTCEPIGCQSDAQCDDATFCNGAETCNLDTGQCEAGTPPVVDDGVSCTEDSCDEANDVVVNAPNNGLCDNGLFCDGSETCDAINDCQAGTPPCDSANETCDEAGDVCEPVPGVLDLDVASLKVTKRVSLTRVKPVGLKLVAKNYGTVEGSALATIIGVQNAVEVYNETLTVTGAVGNGRTTYDDASVPAIPPFVPTDAGDILWTATIDDDDPDIDVATAVTTVVP